MYQFLVRLGRHEYFQYLVPTISCLIPAAYGVIQFGAHDQIRNFLGAESEPGRRQKLSNHLRDLIQEAHDNVSKNGFTNETDNFLNIKFPAAPLKWFISSTLEPITFGSTSVASGLLIGLPSYYNFTRPEDIPDTSFEVRKIALFRSPQDESQEERSKIKEDGIVTESQDNNFMVVRRINRESEEGQDYIDSLILSDDAKRFSIARELFLGDSLRPHIQLFALFASTTLAVAMGRTFVSHYKLLNKHIMNRVPVYLLSGLAGVVNNKFLSHLNNQHYAIDADDKAKALGPEFESGAEEYYSKRARRNKILGIY